MLFSRFQELLKGVKKTPKQFSRQTHGLVSFFLVLFQLFVLLSLDNHVWDREVRIVSCVLLSAVFNLVSFAASLSQKNILFETFFFLSLVAFWIGTFDSALDKLSPLLSQKVALILETELYFMCAIVLMRTQTKVVIFVIGYLRMFVGLSFEDIDEFAAETSIGIIFFIVSFIITALLSLAIVENKAGNDVLQQKQHMRYIDLENILNNDIQQGILIVTPTQSTSSNQLSVRDLKVKYVNNCFLNQFKVSRLLALDVLPLIQARPPKHQPKIEQDIACNYTESTKNILDRSLNVGDGLPKQGATQQAKQRTSIFGLDYSRGNKPRMISQEMNKSKDLGEEQEDKDIAAKEHPAMKTSALKKETIIFSSIQGSNNEQQTTKQQESFPDKTLRLSIEKREKSQSKNNINRRSSSSNNWRMKDSLAGTNANCMSLLDGINLYHQHYLQKNQGQKPAQLQQLESQLIVWEYQSNLAGRQSSTSHPFAAGAESNKEGNLENIMNQSNLQAPPIINEQASGLPEQNLPQPTLFTGQHAPVMVNAKSKGSSPSQSHIMIKLFSDQANSTLEMQPFQNQPTGGSSEVGLIKMQHDNNNNNKQQSLTIPTNEKDMRISRGSGIRQKSYLSHNDKLVAQRLDDNTFEIVRKDKKSKTEIGRGKLGDCPQQDEQDLNEDDDDDEDGNAEGTDYLDIKLFECEMGREESIMIVVNKVNERIKYEKLKEQQEKSEEMLANVTHDLKTPLNCMTLMAEGMKIGKEYNEVAISMILENANLLMCLIQDILDYSQIKKGKLRLLRTTFTPNEAISEVMNLFQMQADQKNIQLVASVEQNCTMNSDKNRIKQILINLVGNALKFTQQGSITITCQIQHLFSHHKIAVFQVKDTGVGMTNQIKSQLFKKFNTFNQKGLNKNGIGLGLTICKRLVMFLGPSDSIDVESEVAKGSVFSFKVFSDLTDIIDNSNKSISEESDDLEYQDSNNKYYEEQLGKHKQNKSKESNQSDDDDQSRRISVSASVPFQGLNSKQNTSSALPSGRSLIKDEDKIEDSMIAVNSFPETIIHPGPEFRNDFSLVEKKKIPSISGILTPSNQLKTMLIVDDSPFNIAAYKLILKQYKPLSIIEAYNGKEAFEKYQKTSFACILMDYNMPIMNGDESTRLIRKFEKTNNLPACKIIIVSGFDNHRKEISKALQFGADAFLTKPVNFQLLFEKLNQMLGS